MSRKKNLRVVKNCVFWDILKFRLCWKISPHEKKHAVLKKHGFSQHAQIYFKILAKSTVGKKRCILRGLMFFFARSFIFRLRKIKLRDSNYTFFLTRSVIFQVLKIITKSCVTKKTRFFMTRGCHDTHVFFGTLHYFSRKCHDAFLGGNINTAPCIRWIPF